MKKLTKKTDLIITVLNEERNINYFLDSVLDQTLKPEEVVVVDGGSGDRTVEIIKEYKEAFKKNGINLIVAIKKGNRSVGRNEAIRLAKNEIVLISDSGCELDKNWTREIIKPFEKKETQVVAGYYAAKTKTVFEKCVVPYVLVMPDKVNPGNFLPATRSMAIKKKVWEEVGSFPEEFSDNEDYVFAHKLKNAGTKIIFAPKAIVYWYPRDNLKDFYKMIFRFARGDAKAGLRKSKYYSYFLRYTVFIVLGILGIWGGLGIFGAIGVLAIYFAWAVCKNYRYVQNWRAIYILPVLQIVSDFAVMAGTINGVCKNERFWTRSRNARLPE